MKKSILYSLVIFLSVFLGGCEKDGPMGYRGRPGVYFNGKEFSYTFAENPWKDVDTVLLPILLTGDLEDYDRKVKVVVVADSTTATGDMYELLEGTISAGSESGFVPVVVNSVQELEHKVVRLRVQIVENEDFKELDLVYPACNFTFTAQIIKPYNWSQLEYFFGPYSTGWWKFIMEKLGRTSLPYWDLFSPIPNPDPDKYDMSYYEMSNIQQMIRLELAEYNKHSTTGPMKHDDGDYAGKEIVVPAPW